MRTKAQLFQTLLSWLRNETGLKVIKTNQGTPRPARPYISLAFLNASVPVGGESQHRINEIPNPETGGPDTVFAVNTSGLRMAVASINVFGENAIDTVAKIRDSLDRPDIIEAFVRDEIAILDTGPINDLTALQETDYEERGQLDVTISFVYESDVDVGTIEDVELSGELNNHDENVVIP